METMQSNKDFRFSLRIHMSLVSSVSHELMDRCEIERNPISLAAVRALGDAHLKCCMQMYYALALMTKGSVRTLIRSVEETNGAEAWRLIHSRYASGTALADAVKYTVVMNRAPIFLRNSLQLSTCANSTALRAALLQWCYSSRNFWERIRPRHLEMERVQMMTGGKLTLSREVRQKAKVKTNTREEFATRALQTSTRARIVANLDIGRKTAGIPVEERMTIPLTEILAKARVTTQAKGKANKWTLSKRNNFSLLKQPQPCRILRKIRVLVENSSCISSVDPCIMGVDTQFRVIHKETSWCRIFAS